jgi:hypothetical protein
MTQDVLNPKPNLRYRSGWIRQQLFQQGQVFAVSPHRVSCQLAQVLPPHPSTPGCVLIDRNVDEEIIKAIKGHSEVIDLTEVIRLYDEYQ